MRQLEPLSRGVERRASGSPVALEAFEQRGWFPTVAYWNQPGPAFRAVRASFVAWLVVVVVGCSFLPGGIPRMAGLPTVALWFFGLGAYERRLRRLREDQRGKLAKPTLP